MSEIKDRLREARVRNSIDTATEAARRFGWTVSTYLGYENGDRQPSREMATRIADSYKVSLDWLLAGKGDPARRPQAKRPTYRSAELEDSPPSGRVPSSHEDTDGALSSGASEQQPDHTGGLKDSDHIQVEIGALRRLLVRGMLYVMPRHEDDSLETYQEKADAAADTLIEVIEGQTTSSFVHRLEGQPRTLAVSLKPKSYDPS